MDLTDGGSMHASVIMEEKRIEERLNLAVMITFERDEEGVTGGVTKYSCMFFFLVSELE